MQWRVCSLVVNYTYYAPTMAPVYLNLSASNDILVFSGDVDSCVPYPGTEENMDLLGYPISVRGCCVACAGARPHRIVTRARHADGTWRVHCGPRRCLLLPLVPTEEVVPMVVR